MHRDLKSAVDKTQSEPLNGSAFDAAMARFAPFKNRVALAVSGGPDSMALASLAHAWADRNGLSVKAFIVDHALRPHSAAEAETTKDTLRKRGIDAEILRWDHAPIISRFHITARKARYKLLAEACHREGISDLLLAHQRNDQAETILMRLAKGSGIDGLAGMAPSKNTDGIRLLRPLLAFPKERLRATCEAMGIPYILDPSNSSEKFARGRLRHVMPLLATEGFTAERLTDLGARAADARAALLHYTGCLLRVATTRDLSGAIRFDLEQLRSAPKAIAERALALCLNALHAEDYPPELVALTHLSEALRNDDTMQPRTLHGCLVSKTATHALILREYAAISDAPSIDAGESVTWDGRWQVTCLAKPPCSIGRSVIRPLGNPPYEVLDRLAPDLRARVPQGRARASLPALWDEAEIAFIPSFTDESTETPVKARLLTVWPPHE